MAKKRVNLAAPIGVEDWQVEDDLRTLTRAEEIERDPKRMAKVKALAKSKLQALMNVSAEKD